jgi:hypothetical protein
VKKANAFINFNIIDMYENMRLMDKLIDIENIENIENIPGKEAVVNTNTNTHTKTPSVVNLAPITNTKTNNNFSFQKRQNKKVLNNLVVSVSPFKLGWRLIK